MRSGPPAGDGGSGTRRRDDGTSLLLPEDGWVVDLTDPARRRRGVRGLVDVQLRGTAASSSLRADLRRQLDGVTAAAAAADGRLMAFSLMRAGDRPLPASLTTFRLAAPPPSLVARRTHPLARFAADRTAAAGDGTEVVVADGPLGPVVREVSVVQDPATLDADGLEQLVARYWLDPDDGQGWYQLVFTTHLVALRDAMLPLFDAVTASVGLDDDAATDG